MIFLKHLGLNLLGPVGLLLFYLWVDLSPAGMAAGFLFWILADRALSTAKAETAREKATAEIMATYAAAAEAARKIGEGGDDDK